MHMILLVLSTMSSHAVEVDSDPAAEAWYHYSRGNHLEAARVAAGLIAEDARDAAAHRVWVMSMQEVDYLSGSQRVDLYRSWVADVPETLLVELGEGIQKFASVVEGSPCRVLQVENRVTSPTQLNPLVIGGQEAATPQA